MALIKETKEFIFAHNGTCTAIYQFKIMAVGTAVIAAAKENENVKKYLEGATIVKEIVVPGKLVSFVVK